MRRTPDCDSQEKLAKRSQVGQSSVSRVLHQQQAATVDMLDALASAFGLKGWQLLVEDLDPSDPPRILTNAYENEVVEAATRTALALISKR